MSRKIKRSRHRKEEVDLKWVLEFRSSSQKPKGFWNEATAVKFVELLQKRGDIKRAAKIVGVSTMTSRMFVTELKQAALKGMGLREYIRKGRPFRVGAKTYGTKGDKR